MKKYATPTMYAKKLNMGRCLDTISKGDGTEGEDGGAKQTNLSFDDEFDSENEW